MASQQINATSGEVDAGDMQKADDVKLEPPQSEEQATDDPDTRPFDFSSKTWREDMTLLVEGRKLYVASNILSLLSPVFTAMFEEQLKEEGPREIELKDKKVDDVSEFLRCLYPNILKRVTEENVFAVLPLAHEFQVKHLQESCEDFLVSMTEATISPDNICKYLLLADRFKMEILHARCVKLAAGADSVLFSDAEKVHPLPLEIKVQVQTRQIQQLKKYEDNCRSLKEYLIYNLIGKGTNQKFCHAEAGVIKLTIPDVSSFKKAKSQRESIHWINWYISAFKTQDKSKGDQLEVYLNARAPSDWHEWTCEVMVKMMLINKDTGKHLIHEFDHTFSSTEPDFGCPSLISITNLTSGHKYVVNDTADINVYFLVNEPVCKPNPQLQGVSTDDASDTESDYSEDDDVLLSD